MKYLSRRLQFLFILNLAVISFYSNATTYHYKADVKGMVCAFCVYSVGKKIRQLPEVDKESVNVSLKNNNVIFSTKKEVSKQDLSEIFSQSGFTLTNLTLTKPISRRMTSSKNARLELYIDVFETDQFTSVLQSIGDLATQKPSRFLIEAPQDQEETILKSILMGRKKPIQVYFKVDNEIDKIHLQMFDE